MRTFGIMLRALGIVAAVEILVMYFLEFLGLPDGLEKSLLDALLLVSLSGPVLYFWVIRVMAQRLSEHHFQEMVQGVRAVVWEAEAAPLALTFVNRHIEDLLSYPASQCLTEKNFWARHVHPEDQESVLNALSGAIVHGKGCESRYRLVAARQRVDRADFELDLAQRFDRRRVQIVGLLGELGVAGVARIDPAERVGIRIEMEVERRAPGFLPQRVRQNHRLQRSAGDAFLHLLQAVGIRLIQHVQRVCMERRRQREAARAAARADVMHHECEVRIHAA